MFMEKLSFRKEMRNTWLVQRLQGPRTWKIAGKEVDNPFSFGGGLKNGGLSDDAMDLLRGIFSFDYMGSAEFEFGAVPAALSFLAERASKKKLITGITGKKDETIYYLCPTEYETEVIKRIASLRKNEIRLKEYCGLSQYFDSNNEYGKENLGWLELDNGFMFFVDSGMYQKTCKLFGVNLA